MKKKTLFSLIFTPFLLVSLAVCITVFFLFNERFKHDEAALLTKILLRKQLIIYYPQY